VLSVQMLQIREIFYPLPDKAEAGLGRKLEKGLVFFMSGAIRYIYLALCNNTGNLRTTLHYILNYRIFP
jgi:hypothetical protein